MASNRYDVSQGAAMTSSQAPARADHRTIPAALLYADHEVALVHWPAEASLREELAGINRPRMLLVEPGSPPPFGLDVLEDWVRMPSSAEDLNTRCRVLRRRSLARTPIHLDSDGLVHRGRAWVALSPGELRLFDELYAHQGQVVSRAQLLRALRPSLDEDDVRAIDSAIRRLRVRLRALGAAIRTVRGVGFLLEVTDPAEDLA
jgi:two-component system OmpR family response regulator